MTEDEKGQERTLDKGESLNKRKVKSVNSQEVNLWVSSPRLASGNSLRENIQDFESLSETVQFTRVCEDASFWYHGMSYKTRPDEDDGFAQIIPLCRKYTFSQVNPQSRSYAAILEGTIVGPVIEVHIVKILDNFEFEIAIPSPNNPRRTSYVLISGGEESTRERIAYPKCRTLSHQRGISL